MKTRILPLTFQQSGGMFLPCDERLHKMAVLFAEKEMGAVPNFVSYARVFVACELGETGKPEKIVGLSAIRMVPDIEQMRYINSKAAKLLNGRMHDWFIDQGLSIGSDIFVRIAEGFDPHRCDNYLGWLETEHAVPAERYVLPVH